MHQLFDYQHAFYYSSVYLRKKNISIILDDISYLTNSSIFLSGGRTQEIFSRRENTGNILLAGELRKYSPAIGNICSKSPQIMENYEN